MIVIIAWFVIGIMRVSVAAVTKYYFEKRPITVADMVASLMWVCIGPIGLAAYVLSEVGWYSKAIRDYFRKLGRKVVIPARKDKN